MKTKASLFAVVLPLLFISPFNLKDAQAHTQSPQTTAKQLLGAIKQCNKPKARQVATAKVVNKLISRYCRVGESPLFFQGCERKHRNHYRCFYYYEGGGINLNVTRRSMAAGYRVESYFAIAD